ncbi:MAG: hypothetical protein ACXWNK_17010 [Vulcanimicrobiaceae bacterium]
MDLYDLPDDDSGLAETVHQRHKYVEHREHEHRHKQPHELVIDCVTHSWDYEYISADAILTLAGRGEEYEALHAEPGADQAGDPVPATVQVYLGNEHVHHFHTRLRKAQE